ncbi:MAG TPA: GPP34 family phosphoprotein [Streptosporangiaceae bacterium]|nr:GPP34 family phosphoprotein [Streptosporangiaceae bacterium]
MDLPQSLPGRMYLLAYNPGRRRMTAGAQLGYVLRAAALADLLLAGAIADVSGKAGAQPGQVVADPLVDVVLQQIASSRPRSWRSWVSKGAAPMKRDVREQLVTEGWIQVEPRRILGLFPVAEVTVTDTRVVDLLAGSVAAALRDPIDEVDPRDAALVALAAAGEIKTALPRARRREHKERIARLSEVIGPVAKALRKVVQAQQAAAASSASSPT